MAEVASAFVSLVPSARGFGSSAGKQIGPQMDGVAKKSGGKFGKVFAYSSMGPLRALGTAALGFFAVSKVKAFFGSAIDEAREAQKVSALTAQVIKSTGGAAGVSAKQVGDLAGSISKKVGIDDEAIQSGLNLLLTFKNVRNEAGAGNKIFDQAGRSITDMAAAMAAASGGQVNFKSASTLVGKALNDPIKGLSALSRVGVTFTAGQKKTITSLVKQGKTMQAQKLILKELKSEFGGAAAAQATSADKARVAWGNLKEQIGTLLLPVVDKIATVFSSKVVPAISTFVTQLQTGEGVGGRVAATFKTVADNVGTIAPVLGVAVGGMVAYNAAATVAAVVSKVYAAGLVVQAGATEGATVSTWSLNAALRANPIGLVVTALTALGIGLVLAYKKSETFRTIVNTAFAAIKAVAIPTLNALKTAVGFVINFVKNHWKLLVVIIGGPIAAAVLLVVKHWNTIKSATTGAVSAVIGFVKSHWQTILATLIAGPFGLAVSLIVKHWGAIKGAVSAGVSKVVGYVKSLPGKITGAVAGFGTLLYNAGRELISGLISGITSKIGDIGSAMGGIASKIKGYLPGSPVKEGPLTSWNGGKAGIRLMELLAKGIRSGKVNVTKAMVHALEGIQEKLKNQRDGLKSTLDKLKGDFASLRDSVSSAFTGDLFGTTASEAVTDEFGNITTAAASAGQNFMANLLAKKGEMTALLAAFQTLKGWGLKPEFLSQLFASGNGGLILDLAGMGKGGALEAGALFGDVTSLSTQLGTGVAKQDAVAGQIRLTNKKLDQVIKSLEAVGPAVGAAVNSVAAKSAKKKRKKK